MSDVLEVKGRIKALLKERKVTENQLSNDGPFSQKVLNNQISHKATLTVEMLLFILDKFPDVSADWLMRGTEGTDAGKVVGDNNIANNRNTTVNDTDAVRGLVAQLAEKDKQLAEKDKQIGQLLQIIAQRPVQ
jgi:hypothetical protein